MLRWYLLFPLLFLLNPPILSKSIQIDSTTQSVAVAPFTDLYIDPSGQLSFDQVRQQRFISNKIGAFQAGYSQAVYWYRFTIETGQKPNPNAWYFLWNEILRDHVGFYIPQQNGTWAYLQGGLKVPAAQKAYTGLVALFPVGFLSKTPQTVYVRLDARRGITGNLTLLTHQAYIDRVAGLMATIWLVIGSQLLRVLYNVILARYIRDTSFRWYVFHTVIVTGSVLGSFGVIGTVLSNWPTVASFMNHLFYMLMPGTYTLFIYSLLSVRVNYPALRWLFWGIIGWSMLQPLLGLLAGPYVGAMSNNYLFIFTGVFLTAICLHALFRRLAINGYLLIPCFITLIPFIFLNLQALGFIQLNWIYPVIYLTNFGEIIVLALVLGRIIQTAETNRLMTEKALYSEKIEAEKRAELDAIKTRFFTNISHEFRTPLTLLLGPINDLRQRFPTETLYEIMQRNALRLQTLINQLLDLARLDSRQMKPQQRPGNLATDLRIWFNSFTSMAEHRQITVSLRQSASSYWASYDADKLEKILTNLMSNALKFTNAGGSVAVEAEYGAGWLALTVSDTGIGIPPEQLPYIFDRFYQADAGQRRGYEGSGIGLALTRELVHLLGGTVEVESLPDQGTTFRVQFPLETLPDGPMVEPVLAHREGTPPPQLLYENANPGQAPVLPDLSTPEKPEQTNRTTVLVVEDNADLRQYIRSVLSGQYQLLEAVDGQEGLELARQHMPDLILTDLMMPRLDGLSLCRALRTDNRTNHIPVVMLTAKAALEDRLEGLETGADDYLTKPFVQAELLVRLQNLVQRQANLRAYYRQQPETTNAPSDRLTQQQTALVEGLNAYIEANLDRVELTVEQLAGSCAMSVRTFNRKLTALTGLSAVEFIRSYRMRRAAELLRTGLLPSETAYRVGFDNLSYFSRVFREEHGKTPSEYAQKGTLSEN